MIEKARLYEQAQARQRWLLASVHSALSLPLITAEGVVGAMNIYAHAEHAFDERAAELGEISAVPTTVAVQNAQVLARTQRLVIQLHAALENRKASTTPSGF